MLASSACLVLVLAAAQPATLTRNFGVMRADKLIAAASQEAGWPLVGHKNLQKTFLYANVKDLTLEEAKTVFAEATGGSWRRRGELEELALTTPEGSRIHVMARQVVDRFFKAHPAPPGELTPQELKAIAAARAKVELAIQAGKDDPGPELAEATRQTPINRALLGLAQTLGRDFWMSLGEGDRVVLSPSPTRMQRPLGPAQRQVMDKLLRETKRFVQAGMGSDEESMFSGMSPVLSGQLPPYFVVAQMSYGSAQCQLVFADDTMWILDLQTALDWQEPPGYQVGDGPFAKWTEALPLTPKGKANLSLKAVDPSKAGPLGLEPEMERAVFSPEERDVNDVGLKEPLDLFAKRLGTGLVAPVDENIWLAVGSSLASYSDLGSLLTWSPTGAIPLKKAGQNQYAGRLESPFTLLDGFDRSRMALLARDIVGPSPMIDVLSRYCLGGEDMATEVAARILLKGYTKRALPDLQPSGRALLRLYGRLDANQKRRAREGGLVLAYAQLHPETQRDLARLLYVQEPAISVPPPPEAKVEREEAAAMTAEFLEPSGPYEDPFMAERSMGSEIGFRSESTNRLGFGIPLDTKITISLSSKEAWYGTLGQANEEGFVQPMGLSMLAYMALEAEKPLSEGDYRVQGIWSGTATALSLKMEFGQGLSATRHVVVDEATGTTRYTLATLPPAFQAALAERKKEIRKMLSSDEGVSAQGAPPRSGP